MKTVTLFYLGILALSCSSGTEYIKLESRWCVENYELKPNDPKDTISSVEDLMITLMSDSDKRKEISEPRFIIITKHTIEILDDTRTILKSSYKKYSDQGEEFMKLESGDTAKIIKNEHGIKLKFEGMELSLYKCDK